MQSTDRSPTPSRCLALATDHDDAESEPSPSAPEGPLTITRPRVTPLTGAASRRSQHPYCRLADTAGRQHPVRKGTEMKPLSQQLSELADRAKKTEDVIAATREKDRAKLESQRTALTDSIAAGKAKATERAAATTDEARTRWSETRQAVEQPFAALRAKADERRKEHDIKKAERHADDAEMDAEDAVDFALYVVDEAEYAVIDAVLARADADDLARGRICRGDRLRTESR